MSTKIQQPIAKTFWNKLCHNLMVFVMLTANLSPAFAAAPTTPPVANFSSGVLAVNTDQVSYQPGQNVYVQMGSLDSTGHTLCNSNLELDVTGPDGKNVLSLRGSASDRSNLIDGGLPRPSAALGARNDSNLFIQHSLTCGDDNVTNNPDYFVNFPAPAVEGRYQVNLINLDTGSQIGNLFTVEKNTLAVTIVRQTATRINPFKAAYQVDLTVTAKQNRLGQVEEFAPQGFILQNFGAAKLDTIQDPNLGAVQRLAWPVSLKAGDSVKLSYQYQAPKISPDIFELGFAQFRAPTLTELAAGQTTNFTGQIIFAEGRPWEIASDASSCISINASTTAQWTDVNAWKNCGGGIPGANSADTAVIASGTIMTLTANESLASVSICGQGGSPGGGQGLCGTNTSLFISSSTTLTLSGALTIASTTTSVITNTVAIGNGTITAASLTIIDGTSAATRISQVTMNTGVLNITGSTGIVVTHNAGTSKMTCYSSCVIWDAGPFATSNNGTLSLSTGTLVMNGSTAQTMGTYATYANLNVSNSGSTVSLGGNSTFSGGITVANGTFLMSTFNATTTAVSVSTGAVFGGGSGTIAISGTSPLTNTGTFSAPTTTSFTSGSASTLNTAAATFYNLSIVGAGACLAGANFTATNNLTVVLGSLNMNTFNATASALTIASSKTFAGGPGILALTGTTPLTNTGTFNAPTTTNFTASSAANIQSANATFNIINILGAGPFGMSTFNATATSLTIFSGDVFAGGSGTLALSGTSPLTNTGTFRSPTTTSFTSGSASTLNTNTATFYNLSIVGAGAYLAGADVIATNNFTVVLGSFNMNTFNATATALTIASAKTFAGGPGILALTGTAPLTNTGTFVPPTTTNFTASSQTTLNTAAANFYTLNILGTGPFLAGAAIVATNTIAVQVGTLNQSSFNATTSSVNVYSSATYAGGSGVIALTGTSPLINTGTFTPPTSTNYTAASAANMMTANEVFNNINLIGAGPFSMSTYNATATAVTVLSGNVFAGGSATLALTGATPITNTGTFNAPTTTSLSSATGATAVASADITFYNLAVNTSGQTFTSNSNTTVSNNLYVNAGTFNTNNKNLSVTATTSVSGTLGITTGTVGVITLANVSINSSGVLTNSANASVTVSGSFTNNSGVTNFTSGTAPYLFTGSGTYIYGSSSFASLGISGTVTQSGSTTVSTALFGGGTLTNDVADTLNVSATTVVPSLTASSANNTVNYTGASQNIDSTTYYNLTISGSGTATPGGNISALGNFNLSTATMTMASNYTFTVTGSSTIASTGKFSNIGSTGAAGFAGGLLVTGTLSGNGTGQMIATGTVTGTGIINLTGNTFEVDSTGKFGSSTAWTFNNLNIGNNIAATTTSISTATTTVTGALTIGATSVLNAGNQTWVLSGSGNPLVVNSGGVFTASTSMVRYQATSATTTVPSLTYYNLDFSPNGGSPAYLAGSYAPALVNHNKTSINAANATAYLGYTLPFTTTNGNTLVVAIAHTQTANVSVITDTAGNTFTCTPMADNSPKDAGFCYASNIKGVSGDVLNITMSATVNNAAIYVSEWFGVTQVSPLDAHAEGTGSVATQDTGALNTNNAKDVIIGAFDDSVGSQTAAAGFTQLDSESYNGSFTEYQIVTATGNWHPTSTGSGSSWAAAGLALKLGASPITVGNNLTLNGSAIVNAFASNTPVSVAGAMTLGTNATFLGALTSSLTVSGNLTNSGAFSGQGPVTVKGGTVSGNGTINMTGGTFEVDGTGNFGGNTSWTFNNLNIGNGTVATTTSISGATTTIAGALNIGSTSSLNAGPSIWVLSGSGNPLAVTNGGTFIASTSQISFQATSGTTTIPNISYYNLDVNPSSGSPSFSFNATNTPTFVQNNSSVLGVAVTIASTTFASANTGGNTIIAAIRYSGNTSLTGFSDSKGNNYTFIASSTTGSTANDGVLSLYYASNIKAGFNTLNATVSAASNVQISASEVSGLALANALDQFALATSTGGASALLTSRTTAATSQASEYLVGVGTSVGANGNPWSAGANYTLRSTASVERLGWEDRLVNSVGTYNATLNQNASNSWVMGVMVFKPFVPATVNVANNFTMNGPAAVNAFINNTSITVSGSIAIGSSPTYLAATSSALNVFGSFTNAGTFIHNNGTVNFTNFTPAYVQGKTNNTGSVSTINVTFNNNVTAGNIIAVGTEWFGAVTLNNVTATCVTGNLTLVNNPTLHSGDYTAAMGYGVISSSGACTVTFNYSGTVNPYVFAEEISGVNTTSPLDLSKMNIQNGPAGANAVTSGSITTTQNGDYILGYAIDASASAGVLSPGTGFTQRLSIPGGAGLLTEESIQSLAGPIATTFTMTNLDDTTTGIMAFKPAYNANVTVNTGGSALYNMNVLGSGTLTSQSTTSVAGILNVSSSSFNAGTSNVILTGNGAPLTVATSATFTASTSKVSYQATTGTTTPAGVNYYNLDFSPSGGSPVYALSSQPISLIAITSVSNSGTITTPAINTTGASLIVVSVSYYGADVASVSDSAGNTWQSLPTYFASDNSRFVKIFYAYAPINSTSQTFTCSGTGSFFPTCIVSAWSGTLNTSAVFDTQNGASTAAGVTSLGTNSITPLLTGDIVISAFSGSAGWSGSDVSINSGFSIFALPGNGGALGEYGASAYLISSSTSAISPTWSWGSTNPGNAAAIVAFKAAPLSVSNNLTVSGPATVNANVNNVALNVTGNTTIGSSATYLAAATATATLSGSLTVSGTFIHNNGLVAFNTSGTTATVNTGNSSLYNMTMSGTGTLTSQSTTSVANILTVNQGGVFNAGTSNVILTGSGNPFVVSGTFTASTSKVSYQAASGTTTIPTNLAFYNLDVSPTSGTPNFSLTPRPVTLVQNMAGGSNFGATTVNTTFGSNNTAGNTIVALVKWFSPGGAATTLSSVTDSQGNSYTLIPSSYVTAPATHYPQIASEIAYASNIKGGLSLNTITSTLAATDYMDVSIYELTPGSLDLVSTSTATSTIANAGTVTTAVNGEFGLVSAIVDDGFGIGSFVAAGAGWTRDQSTGGGNFDEGTEYQAQTTAGSLTGNFSAFGGSYPWVASMVTFKPLNQGKTTVGNNFTLSGPAIVNAVASNTPVSVTGNMTLSGSSKFLPGSATTSVAGNLAVTSSSTVSGSGNVVISGGTVSGDGTINLTGGSFEVDGTGNFGGNTAWTFNNLNIGNSISAAITSVSATTTTVSNILSIGSTSSLNAGPSTLVLTSSGTPFSVVTGGAFTASSSTVSYRGAATTTPANVVYNNLDFSPATGTPIYQLGNGTSGYVTPTFIQGTYYFSGCGGATHCDATFNSNVVKNHIIAVGVEWGDDATSLTSVTATCVSGNFTLVNNPTPNPGKARTAMGYAVIATSGSCTVTSHYSGGVNNGIMAEEISGVNTASPFDGSTMQLVSAPGAGTDAASSGNITTTQNGDYLFGFGFDSTSNGIAWTAGTGYVNKVSVPNFMQSEDKIQTTAGAVAATFTITPSYASPITGIMAFKPALAGWYDNSWQYRKPITISHNYVASSTTETYPNFPVLISLGSDANLAANAQKGGNDIFFTLSDGTTKLNHQIESYSSTTGQLLAWVQVPSLSSVADLPLFMYYGSSTAISQATTTGAWDSNYVAVWHLGNGTNLTANDSTANANNANTLNSATAGSGQIGGGAVIDGNNAHSQIFVPSSASLTFASSSSMTVEVWAKVNSLDASFRELIRKGVISAPNEWFMTLNSSNKIALSTSGNSGEYTLGATFPNDTNFHHIVGTFDGANIQMYVDGVASGASYPGIGPATTTEDLSIGYVLSGVHVWNGTIDEVRVSKGIARSSDWIKTEYYNQSATSSFYSVGGQQGFGGTVAFTVLGNLTTGGVGSPKIDAYTNNVGLTVSGNVTIGSTGTLLAPSSSSFTITGNFTNNGTFTHESGTVTFATSSVVSTINGSTATTFYNITVNTPAKTLQFENSHVTTIAGKLNLTGAAGLANLVTIKSDSPGVKWQVHFSTAQTGYQYVLIQDSGCDSGTAKVTLTGGVLNNGNNDLSCWVFPIGSKDSGLTNNVTGGGGGGVTVGGGGSGGGGSNVIMFDAQSMSPSQNSSGGFSWNHTVGTASNRILLVGVATEGGDRVTGITYAGAVMTKITSFGLGTGKNMSVWGILNPASGTNSVTVTLSPNDFAIGMANSFSGVNQSLTLDKIATTTGNNSTLSNSIASVANNTWAIDFISTMNNNAAYTAATFGLPSWLNDGSLNQSAATAVTGPQATPGSVTNTWSFSGAALNYADVMLTIAQAGGSSGTGGTGGGSGGGGSVGGGGSGGGGSGGGTGGSP